MFTFEQTKSLMLRPELDHADVEAVWLDILLPKSKPILVRACYRPPDQHNFYELLEEICAKSVDFVKSEVMIIGDLNTDILKKDSSICKALRSFCNLFDLHQLITQFTRVCADTQTIIVLILVSDQSKIWKSGVIDYGLSDHSMIFCTRKIKKVQLNCHNTIKARSLKNYSKDALFTLLRDTDWSPVFNCAEVDKAWVYSKSLFLVAVDTLAPVKNFRIKVRTEPWINADIFKAIKKRNVLFN